MSNEIVLYMYAALVGLVVGQSITNKGDDIMISLIGMCGYTYLLLFKNPGQNDLEEAMYVICTLSAGIIACLCYIILHKENQDFNDLYKEKEDEQDLRDHVRGSLPPQGIGDVLHRQDSSRTSVKPATR